MIKIAIPVKLLVIVLFAVFLSVLGAWIISNQLKQREANRQAQITSHITAALQQQKRDAQFLGAVELDKVYLISWKGSDTEHLGLYLGGIIVDVSSQVGANAPTSSP